MNTFLSRISERKLFVFGILLAFALICYVNVIDGPMLFDDEHFIEKNLLIQSLDNIPDIYTTSVTEGAYIGSNFYRPNQQVVYAFLYHFFKLSPVAYHLISILLHLLNAFFVFLLLVRFSFSRNASFIAALLFLIHPVQVEAVSYISGLADPLGLFFLLLGLLSYQKGLISRVRATQWTRFALSVAFFVAALFTKENQVIFLPLSIIVGIYTYVNEQKRADSFIFISTFVLVLIASAYLFLKLTVFNFTGEIGLTDASNIYTENLFIRLLTFLSIQWDYFTMIIFPLRLNYEKPYMAYADIVTLRSLFGIMLVLITLFFTIRLKRHRRIFLGLSWFFACLVPFSGIIPLNAMFLEHWLYVPLIGISILLASLYDWLLIKGKSQIFLIILILVVILFSIRVILRNKEWSDIERFYLNELKYTDSSIRIYNNLAMYYADEKVPGKAIYYYEKAIEVGDFFPQPHHNLANLFHNRGDINKAIDELHKALRID
ncbi:MAG: tetratricopeptide repeat protein, partial [Bacteroidales bacterium]|nr:tetratricopeptide repeat protein [Bacteroidales bacterium]